MRKYLNIKETSTEIKNAKSIETPESDYFKLPEKFKLIPETRTEAPFEIVNFREFTQEEKEKNLEFAKEKFDYIKLWNDNRSHT